MNQEEKFNILAQDVTCENVYGVYGKTCYILDHHMNVIDHPYQSVGHDPRIAFTALDLYAFANRYGFDLVADTIGDKDIVVYIEFWRYT